MSLVWCSIKCNHMHRIVFHPQLDAGRSSRMVLLKGIKRDGNISFPVRPLPITASLQIWSSLINTNRETSSPSQCQFFTVLISLPFLLKFSQSVPVAPLFFLFFLPAVQSDMFQKVIYAVWLCRSELIRCITCQTRFYSPGSCGFVLASGVAAVPHWFSCVRKTVVQRYSQSVSHSGSITHRRTHTHTHTYNAVGKWLKLPPTRARPCAF